MCPYCRYYLSINMVSGIRGSILHSQGVSIIPILSGVNPVPRIDIYPFKIKEYSYCILLPTPKYYRGLFSVGLPFKVLQAVLTSQFLVTCPADLDILIMFIILG